MDLGIKGVPAAPAKGVDELRRDFLLVECLEGSIQDTRDFPKGQCQELIGIVVDGNIHGVSRRGWIVERQVVPRLGVADKSQSVFAIFVVDIIVDFIIGIVIDTSILLDRSFECREV